MALLYYYMIVLLYDCIIISLYYYIIIFLKTAGKRCSGSGPACTLCRQALIVGQPVLSELTACKPTRAGRAEKWPVQEALLTCRKPSLGLVSLSLSVSLCLCGCLQAALRCRQPGSYCRVIVGLWQGYCRVMVGLL